MTMMRKTNFLLRPRLWSFSLLILLVPTLLVPTARADGGAVLCNRTAAPLNITVFLSETPLRPGPADLSVLIERIEDQSTILDGQVFFELEHEEGTIIRAEATRLQARNKLLYCSVIDIPLSGHWKMKVHVVHDNKAFEVLSDLVVAPPQPLILAYWKLTVAPAFIIILFIINQWLRQSRNFCAQKHGSSQADALQSERGPR